MFIQRTVPYIVIEIRCGVSRHPLKNLLIYVVRNTSSPNLFEAIQEIIATLTVHNHINTLVVHNA